MKDTVFVSVCFGDPRYFEQQQRLKESILKIYPEANLLFYRGQLPLGSRSFFDSLYGFKPHAIQVARQSAKKVIFLDPAMVLNGPIDYLSQFEMMAVKDDNKLFNVVSNRCYQYFGITQQEVFDEGWHLVGGSIYYFDFASERTENIFNTWMEAEKKGMFGSQTEQATDQLQGHRMDEAVMALCMYFNGIEPQSMEASSYCHDHNPIWTKLHFK